MDNSDKDFIKLLQEIKYDIGNASLEDIDKILNHYDSNFINPMMGECLNVRYRQLTGKNHPIYLKEHKRKLDEIIKSDNGIRINGMPTVYEKLRNNLTGNGPGIKVLFGNESKLINRFNNEIKYDIGNASLEEVKGLLDYYDQDSFLIDGSEFIFRPNVFQGASLNARYHELTGEDHPVFISVQNKLLDQMIKSKHGLIFNDEENIYKQLKKNSIEIGNSNHILTKTILDAKSASLEDVTSYLNYFDGDPVIINGVVYHSFNDPMFAKELNERYYELTGKNHPTYIKKLPIVVDRMLKKKNVLTRSGAFNDAYFETLKQMKQDIQKNQELEDMFCDKNNRFWERFRIK